MIEMGDLKKFPKVRQLGHPDTEQLTAPGEVVIQEKMDGANFRFRVQSDGSLVVGSRDKVYTNPEDIPDPFMDTVEYVQDQSDSDELREDVTYFGESMHPHTIEYDWPSVPPFLGFAVYNHKRGDFEPWPTARELFNRADLPTVPVVETCQASEVATDYDIPESEYYDGIAEGVVFWHENTSRAKLRSQEFKESHMEDSDPEEFAGETILVQQYCTPTRIDKQIDKLVDEGHSLERSLMGEGLPQAVARDILEEHAHEIVSMNETVDLKGFRSRVAKVCLTRIDERMQASFGE